MHANERLQSVSGQTVQLKLNWIRSEAPSSAGSASGCFSRRALQSWRHLVLPRNPLDPPVCHLSAHARTHFPLLSLLPVLPSLCSTTHQGCWTPVISVLHHVLCLVPASISHNPPVSFNIHTSRNWTWSSKRLQLSVSGLILQEKPSQWWDTMAIAGVLWLADVVCGYLGFK